MYDDQLEYALPFFHLYLDLSFTCVHQGLSFIRNRLYRSHNENIEIYCYYGFYPTICDDAAAAAAAVEIQHSSRICKYWGRNFSTPRSCKN